jgi:hypothetical protein
MRNPKLLPLVSALSPNFYFNNKRITISFLLPALRDLQIHPFVFMLKAYCFNLVFTSFLSLCNYVLSSRFCFPPKSLVNSTWAEGIIPLLPFLGTIVTRTQECLYLFLRAALALVCLRLVSRKTLPSLSSFYLGDLTFERAHGELIRWWLWVFCPSSPLVKNTQSGIKIQWSKLGWSPIRKTVSIQMSHNDLVLKADLMGVGSIFLIL